MGCTSSSSNSNVIANQKFTIGESIHCAFGIGKIDSFRANDQIYVVTLQNWKLAQGQSPTLFLNETSIMKLQTSEENALAENPLPLEASGTVDAVELRKEEKVTESLTTIIELTA